MNNIWFSEPIHPDPTHQRRGESTFRFLNRSTWIRAVAIRKFLNVQMSFFPIEIQQYFFNRLNSHWNATVFELMVARSLQVLEAELEFEVALSSGSRPDFNARFSDTKVIVEAKAPQYFAEETNSLKHSEPLLDIIETYVPEGWWANVMELPEIGLSQSKNNFKKRIMGIMDEVSRRKDDNFYVTDTIQEGSLELFFIRTSHKGGLGGYSGGTSCGDGEEQIRKAFKHKKKQVNGANQAVILAIQRSGWSFDIDACDTALFGSSIYDLDNHTTSERAGGVFALHRLQKPTIDAIVLFDSWNWVRFDDPIIYINPRSLRQLPNSLLKLPQRLLGPNKIDIVWKGVTRSTRVSEEIELPCSSI